MSMLNDNKEKSVIKQTSLLSNAAWRDDFFHFAWERSARATIALY